MEDQPVDIDRRAVQALLVWIAFIVLNVLLNGTIPFALGADLHPWTESAGKSILSGLLIYAGLFLMVPLILIKGWETVRQPGLLLPLLVAVVAIALWQVVRGVATVSIIVLAYLHCRFDLSEYGIRSRGWKGDAVAVLLLGALSLIPVLLRGVPVRFTPGTALLAGLDRLFANPASSVENLFYFGFLAERLSHRTGRGLTPFLVGLMYTAHEMTNPEYWYEGMNFLFVFMGVTVYTAIYLWRRGVVAIWLGNGLGRVVTSI